MYYNVVQDKTGTHWPGYAEYEDPGRSRTCL